MIGEQAFATWGRKEGLRLNSYLGSTLATVRDGLAIERDDDGCIRLYFAEFGFTTAPLPGVRSARDLDTLRRFLGSDGGE